MVLLVAALAVFYLWNLLRFFLPLVVPDRLALLFLAGLAYGTLEAPWSMPRTALAVAGGAVLLIRVLALLGVDVPEPWDWRPYAPRLPRRKTMTGTGHVPGQAPAGGKIGRRIPRL